MARPPDSSTPPSQSLPHPPGESKLELMPTEVLEEIFCHLSQNGLQSFHDLQDENLLEENRSAHANMRSLCLTSNRVGAVASPLLFRAITISSTAMLVKLYETLLETPDLGSHIKQISFEILLMGDMESKQFLAACFLQGTTLLEGCDSVRTAHVPYITNYRCDHVLSASYFEILRRTPNVHQLVLRIQTIEGPPSTPIYGLGGIIQRYMYQAFFRKVKHAMQISPSAEVSGFLPRLTTLHLLGDPDNHWNVFDIAICEPLLRLHTLKEVTTFRDNGHWSALKLDTSDPHNPGSLHARASLDSDSLSAPGPTFKNIKKAELRQSACLSHDFLALGNLLAHVEVLKISSRGDVRSVLPFSHDGSRVAKELRLDDGHEYFHEALQNMRNLHTLTLDLHYGAFSGKFGMPVPMNPTLASLPKLATIKIPLQMLIEDHGPRDTEVSPNRTDRLVEILPKSLRSLTIMVEVCCTHHGQEPPLSETEIRPRSSTIIDFMEALSRLGHEAFPELKEVVCCYNMSGDDCSPDDGDGDFISTDFGEEDLFEADAGCSGRLDLLRMSLQQQQMQFKVAYDNVHCRTVHGWGYYRDP